MDKRSFNLLFTIVAASMVILGTYKIARKKPAGQVSHVSTAVKNNK